MPLSATFVITSLGTTQAALLNREMNFRSLELRMMAGTFCGGAFGITTAAAGWGAWAIIGQQVTAVSVSTALLWWFSAWRPRFTFSLTSLRSLGGFSGNVFGTRMLFYVNRNVDNLLVGRFIGPAALGAYSVAYNLMLSPLSRIAWPIQSVLFPAFAQMQDDPDRMATGWFRVNRLVGAITIPAMLGLIAVAPDFVHVVLGQKWHLVTPIIEVLAWVGLLQSLQSLNSSVLQARDRTRTLLWYAFVALAASLVGFVGGLHWGVVGVAVGYAISSTFVEPYYTWLTSRALGVSVWRFVRNLAGVAQASVGMFVLVLATRALLVDRGVPAAARLVLLIVLGVVSYAALARWRAPEIFAEIRELLPKRRAARTTVPAPARPAEH
jgi:O-antigen/teichoic acid export membrane protein